MRDTERLTRFRREAQVLASLNHPAHRGDLRARGAGRPGGADSRAGRRRNARRADRSRSASDRRGARDRAPDRPRPRGRAREGDRAPGSQAREREARPGRTGQGARLRARESARHRRVLAGHHVFADDDRGRDAGRRRARHGRLHVAGAGARQARRRARRHLGLRDGALRDAHGPQGLRGRDGLRHARGDPHEGAGLERAAGRHAGVGPPRASPLPRPGPEDAHPRHRRRAPRARRALVAAGRPGADPVPELSHPGLGMDRRPRSSSRRRNRMVAGAAAQGRRPADRDHRLRRRGPGQ